MRALLAGAEFNLSIEKTASGMTYRWLGNKGTALHCCAANTPPKAMALNDQGVAACDHKDWTTAFEKLEAALRIEPNYANARANLAVAHNNYGMSLKDQNKEEALKQFRLAQYLQPENLDFLGNVKYMIKALGRDPDSCADRIWLGDQAKDADDLVGSIIEYDAALLLKNDPEIHKKLGDAHV